MAVGAAAADELVALVEVERVVDWLEQVNVTKVARTVARVEAASLAAVTRWCQHDGGRQAQAQQQ